MRHNYWRYCKVAAMLVFIATPGSLLVLPLVAWWIGHRARGANAVSGP